MFILKKEEEYFVGGVIVWSHSPIRAVLFSTLEEAIVKRKLLQENYKITIEEISS